MRSVPLGDLIQPARVHRAGRDSYPVLSMTMRDGLVAQSERFKKRIASRDVALYKVVEKGQLVVGFPINEGVLDFQSHYASAIVSPAYGIWDVVNDVVVDRSYLKRFLRSPRAIEYYVAKMKGSTARRRSLPLTEFQTLPVPLPPLLDQRRIAAILDHADALRAKRRQVLAYLDDFSQSIFHDMFGSEMTGDNRVELRTIAALITKGTTPTSVGLKFTREGVPFVRVQNLQQGQVWFGPEDFFIDAEAHEALRRSTIRPRDLLISIAGTIGRVAIVADDAPDMNCNQAVAIIRLKDPGTGPWLAAWLNSRDARRQIGLSSVTATISNLSLSQIGQLRVPVVSEDAIRRYVRRSEAKSLLRNTVLTAQAADEVLFASLDSRAFRGEL